MRKLFAKAPPLVTGGMVDLNKKKHTILFLYYYFFFQIQCIIIVCEKKSL